MSDDMERWKDRVALVTGATSGIGRAVAREKYSRFMPLQPENIASIVRYALSCPPHVQVHDILVRSTDQPN